MTATGWIQRVYCDLGYRFGFAEWDIREPQPDLVALAEEGGIPGESVLDVGCGAGENSIYLALRGHRVTGIDSSAAGIRTARRRAKDAGARVDFLAGDALEMGAMATRRNEMAERFDCALDFGLLHMLGGGDVETYVENLASVLKPGGSVLILCMSEDAPPETMGPRRMTQGDIADAFAHGWSVEWIRSAGYHSRRGSSSAWLAMVRLDDSRPARAVGVL